MRKILYIWIYWSYSLYLSQNIKVDTTVKWLIGAQWQVWRPDSLSIAKIPTLQLICFPTQNFRCWRDQERSYYIAKYQMLQWIIQAEKKPRILLLMNMGVFTAKSILVILWHPLISGAYNTKNVNFCCSFF